MDGLERNKDRDGQCLETKQGAESADLKHRARESRETLDSWLLPGLSR